MPALFPEGRVRTKRLPEPVESIEPTEPSEGAPVSLKWIIILPLVGLFLLNELLLATEPIFNWLMS